MNVNVLQTVIGVSLVEMVWGFVPVLYISLY